MRLSSLELQGFKSFPDKTRLEFDDGITAVVGPNGSGKSNIADAVRWVLGEQSTKTLRGGKMEDIIFSGTQLRKAVGYASVQLTIDNKGGELPDQEEEISIGRRLYRSGESEYRINGTVVRLKDVHELFMDTGLGRDGYSIIGQGRISEIVSAKSAQRREIFEEAAGIAKFRYRRTEAERRLDGAQENLLRLNDILSELEVRVGPLKVQSEKAKKYLELAEERKDLEISLWVDSLEGLKGEVSSQQDKILIAKNDYEQLEWSGEALETKLAGVFEQMQQLGVAADERRHSIRNLEEEQSRNGSQVAVLNNDIGHNTQNIQRLEQEQLGAGKGEEALAAQLAKQQLALEEGQLAFDQLGKDLGELAAHQGELAQSLENVGTVGSGIAARKSALEQAVAKIQLEQAASRSLLSESSSRLKNLEEKGSEHDSVVVEYQDNLTECDVQIARQKDLIASLENAQKGYQLKRDSRLEKVRGLEQSQEKLRREKEQKENRARLLQEMEAAMEGYGGSVKFILGKVGKGELGGVFGAVSSLISTNPQHIVAVETALGGAMQNLVVEDENAAKRCIALLKDAKIGRATFLPLTSVKGKGTDFSHLADRPGFVGAAAELVGYLPQYEGVIQQLLGRICVVDDLNTGTVIAKEAGYRFRVVTLDGQVINAGGSYTGGAVSRSGGVLGRRNEIGQLKKEVVGIEGQLKENLPLLKEASQELAGFEATLTGSAAEIRSVEEELVHLGFSREQLEKSLASAQYNRDLAKEELERLSGRLKALEEGRVTAQQMMAENQEKITQLTAEETEAEEQHRRLTQQQQLVGEELAKGRLEELGQKNQLENQAGELERLKEQLDNADATAQKLTQELESLTKGNQEILEEIERLGERKALLVEEILGHNQNIAQFTDQRTQLEQSTTLLRQQERELLGKREEISREMARLEERRNGMQSQYDELIAKLWDEYQLTRTMAKELAKPLEDSVRSQQRLSELRSSIRGLGSVNLEAVEEYAEVSERYEFLSAQVADVEQSREKLLGLIKELTGEMRTLFMENFVRISEEFSKTFVELFGGGHGELKLSDEEDVLEAGIEIHVQPPGKVIKSLSLLSGGEQAFVAIAIYFAILKVKPAPFVLLDEIEAALDDVNVVKFAQYLRTLSDNTQFIAITHRRGTMEEADVLYGVTMQEEGVSKLLALKVQEVESKLGMGAEL